MSGLAVIVEVEWGSEKRAIETYDYGEGLSTSPHHSARPEYGDLKWVSPSLWNYVSFVSGTL
jgi:hypothetical protein